MKNYWHKFVWFYNRNGFLINLLGLLVLMVISLCLVNRAFVVGSFIAIILLLIVYKKIKFTKRSITIIVLFIFFLIMSLAFLVKSDSTWGRLFIYKISWKMFTDYFLTGIGFGQFQIKYNLYQSAYFMQDLFTEREFLLADSVFYAFNDYWQFIIEFGVLGLLSEVIGLFLIFNLIKRGLVRNYHNHFMKLIVCLLILVLVSALFTHVFEKSFFISFLTLSLVWLVYMGQSKEEINSRGRKIFFVLFTLGALLFQYFNDIVNLQYYRKFEQAKLLGSAGYNLESQILYTQIFPKLKEDVWFFMFYCDALSEHKDRRMVLSNYLLLTEKRTDYRVFQKLAVLYEKMGNTLLAEECYRKAMHMVPNRFSSRLLLFDFYLRIGDITKARELGYLTLKMPEKIPSYRVDYIKNEIRKKITK